MSLDDMTQEVVVQEAAPQIAPSVNLSDTFISSVPEQYRTESFVQDIARTEDPTQELWTKFAGMHSALQTQPGGMPAIDASAEDWAKWSSAIAPKDVSVYGDLKPVIDESKAHIKDLLDPVYTPEIMGMVMENARQLGVQPHQMKGLIDTFNNLQVQAAEDYYNSQQQASQEYNQQFDDFCAKQFGKDRDKIVGEGFNFIAQNVSKDLVTHVNNLPNEALATVAALAYNLKQKYGVEDRLPQADSLYTGGGGDIVSLKSAIGEKMNSPEYRNAFDARHNQIVAEVQQLSSQLARLTQPRKGY
jgi:hypothetical protein